MSTTRNEWRLVRTETSGCREERRIYGRGPVEESALRLFAEFAPYGPRGVIWTIEQVQVTEERLSNRTMTPEEVKAVTSKEASRLGGAHAS